MENQDDVKKKSAAEKQLEDKIEIAKNKAKLAQHKAEEVIDNLGDSLNENLTHAKNVATEKITEISNSVDETVQKVKNRLDEKLGK